MLAVMGDIVHRTARLGDEENYDIAGVDIDGLHTEEWKGILAARTQWATSSRTAGAWLTS